MKVWQLSSIVEQRGLIFGVASENPAWSRYREIYGHGTFKRLVQGRRRDVLDALVDEAFVEAVLSRVDRQLYLSDGQLRSFRWQEDEALSMLEAFRRFGSDAVEEAIEKGSIAVSPSSSASPS